MSCWPKAASLCLAVAVSLPASLAAQGAASSRSSESPPRTTSPAPVRTAPPLPTLNAEQEMGKGLFFQNCAICHMPDRRNPKNTDDPGTTVGPRLNEVFHSNPAPRDDVIRTFIQKGSQKMPGFQYGLTPKEIDSIIAYLKTL